MEWQGSSKNFCACILCILKDYSVSKSLAYFNLTEMPAKDKDFVRYEGKRKKTPPFTVPREELRVLYEDKLLTQYQIAKIYNVSQNTISQHLNKHGIQIRNTSYATKLSYAARRKAASI